MRKTTRKFLATAVLVPLTYGITAPAAMAQENSTPASPTVEVSSNFENTAVDMDLATQKKTVVSSEKVPFNTHVIEDDTLPAGSEVVVQEGSDGIRERYISSAPSTKVDGSVGSIEISHEKMTTAPQNKIIRKGTGNTVIKTVDSQVEASEAEARIKAATERQAKLKAKIEAKKAVAAAKAEAEKKAKDEANHKKMIEQAKAKAEQKRIAKAKADAAKAEAEKKAAAERVEAEAARVEAKRKAKAAKAQQVKVEAAGSPVDVQVDNVAPAKAKSSAAKRATSPAPVKSSTPVKKATPAPAVRTYTPAPVVKTYTPAPVKTAAPVSTSGAMTPSEAKAYARDYMGNTYGWGDSQFRALEKLWERESGWNYRAANPHSSARGIPQAMMSVHFGGMNTASAQRYLNSAPVQIQWGLNYIQKAYGSPSAALAHSNALNWY